MKPEVLAPVGSRESLIAAVYSGADAVYFGAKQFNARRGAENFDDSSLHDTISFCRLFGVKSYLTLNILIKEIEMADALLLAKKAADFGVDAVIVQDLGLARLIKKHIPNLPLHASTQMSVHSPAALKLLKELGFTRVVPAREMSKDELEVFCKEADKLGIEVETFVHGALCMCLSGQCYFSAHLGGRSANRGLCAGTCRLPFSAKGGTGYDLSLKDLSLVNKIATLTKMGVASFKIEGRMKRPEYVAASVNCVKQAISSENVDCDDLDLLQKVFSRSGFTDGYFSKNLGKDMFGVRTEKEKEIAEKSLSKLHELYRRPNGKVKVDFELSLLKGTPVKLTAKADGFSVSVIGEKPMVAINKPTTMDSVKTLLSKLGSTPYCLGSVLSNIEDGLMLPASSINALKNSALEELNKKRTAPKVGAEVDFDFTPKARKKDIKGYFLRFANVSQMPILENDIVGFSLPADEILRFESIEELLNATNTKTLPFAELYRGAGNDGQTLSTLQNLKGFGIKGVVCQNLSEIVLAKEMGFAILLGFGLNLYNGFAIETIKALGINGGVISPELSLKEQPLITRKDFETYAFLYGRFPLMLTKNCPVKNGVGCKEKENGCTITDRLGEIFPIVCGGGYSEILNSRPTNVADQQNLVSADYCYLYFTLEEKAEVEKVLEGFRNGVSASKTFTRGLTKNGVL